MTTWRDLLALFKVAESKHGRIDHVFANAGKRTVDAGKREAESPLKASLDFPVMFVVMYSMKKAI